MLSNTKRFIVKISKLWTGVLSLEILMSYQLLSLFRSIYDEATYSSLFKWSAPVDFYIRLTFSQRLVIKCLNIWFWSPRGRRFIKRTPRESQTQCAQAHIQCLLTHQKASPKRQQSRSCIQQMFICCGEQTTPDINNLESTTAMLANPQWLVTERQRIQNQLSQITRLDAQLQRNYGKQSEIYLVSSRWFEKWRVFVKEQLEQSQVYLGGMLPVLNEDIVEKVAPVVFFDVPFENKNVFLKTNLKEIQDFRVVSRAIWDVLKRYANIPIRRSLHYNPQGKLFTEAYFEQFQCIIFSRSVIKKVAVGQFPYLPMGPIQFSKFDNIQLILSELTKSLCKVPNNYGVVAQNAQSVRYWRMNDSVNIKQWAAEKCKAQQLFDSSGARLRILVEKQAQLISEEITEINIKESTTIIAEVLQTDGSWVLFNSKASVVDTCPSCMNWKYLKYMCVCKVYFFCSEACCKRVQAQHKSACDMLQKKTVPGLQPMKFYNGRSGLINMGNSCYLNACIQCLCSIQSLNQLFISGEYRKYLKVKGTMNISDVYSDLLRRVYSQNNFPVSPIRLKNHISKRFSQFQGSHQQDSSQFLLCLLNCLSEDFTAKLSNIRSSKTKSSTQISKLPPQVSCPIINLFYGQLESKLSCKSCSKSTHTFQPFLIWQLPIPCPTKVSVQVRFVVSSSSIIETTIICPTDKKISYLISQARDMYSVPTDEIIVYLATPFEFEIVSVDSSVQNAVARTDAKLYLRKLEYEEVYLDGVYVGVVNMCQGSLLGDLMVFSFRRDCFAWQVMSFLKNYFKGDNAIFNCYQNPLEEPRQCTFCSIPSCPGCIPPNSTLFELTLLSGSLKGYVTIQVIWQSVSKQLNEFLQVIGDKHSIIKNEVDIKTCIAKSANDEEIEDWSCEGCRKKTTAVKKMGICKLPPILIIHLKRFRNGPTSNHKIEIPVIYPEILDLNTLNEKAQYRLTAVCKHQGSLDSGHYTAQFIDFSTNTWYKADDQYIAKLSQINPAHGYIMFYSRIR